MIKHCKTNISVVLDQRRDARRLCACLQHQLRNVTNWSYEHTPKVDAAECRFEAQWGLFLFYFHLLLKFSAYSVITCLCFCCCRKPN